jgi:hypothetical protein
MKTLITCICSALLPLLGAIAAPEPAVPAAWIRFDDGVEQYEGTPYRFLGKEALALTFFMAPSTNLCLELQWGAKGEMREATVTINGTAAQVSSGGYRGFKWVRVASPKNLTGERYNVTLTRSPAAGAKAAFLGGVRLVELGSTATPPDPKPAAYKAKLESAKVAVAENIEAFPEMRKVWDREPATPASDPRFRQAEKNARQANEAWYRSRRFIDGWLAHADPKTGLIPRNLRESNYWNGRDSAADNYPFMVLTAAMTDRGLMDGRLLDMLRTETKLTCRVDRLPDDFSFAKQGWRREKVDLDAIIFDGAEYVKDGLLPITEWLGPSPWSERMLGIIDDTWKNATIETPFGKIPTLNFEVNGDLLQACARLYWFTGDRKYLDWAIRLGDYYLLGNQHPTRDMRDLALGDHSCEVINGLSELYLACHFAAPEKKQAYTKPLHELYDQLLKIARDEHGLFYLRVNTRTGEHTAALTDNWGYNLDGLYTVFMLDGTTAYRDAVRLALGNLKAHHTGQGGMCQSSSADGYADSIEGAITLCNREPTPSAADWIDTEIKTMWGKQKPDGVIEGWHGDGNSARTSLMYALWKTQGVRVEPWRSDVRIGTVRDGAKLYISLSADQPWTGKLVFDRARHKEVMHLPLDYPRINQFPEWFTVQSAKRYALAGLKENCTGAELSAGVPVTLQAGQELQLEATPK